MTVRRCLICERTGLWANALRSGWPADGPRIVETRSWSDLLRELTEAPESAVCLEVAGVAPDEFARRLTTLHRDFPAARALVLSDEVTAGWEWLWRDCGAIEVARSPRDTAAATRIATRHCRRGASEDRTLREQLWRRLPWPEAAREAKSSD